MEHSKLRAPLETEEVENNWAISYGDMITLLLGFFVIFFNIKTETVNLTLLKKDLDQYFDSAKLEAGRSVAQVSEKKAQESPPILTSDISNTLQIKSNMDGERILVEFPGISFFNSASHNLTLEGKLALADFSKAIDKHLGLFRLVVRGYTDALPLNPRSKYKDNLELSAFRSISAIRFLAQEGVNLEHMRIAGYGESSVDRNIANANILEDQRKVVIVIEPLDHTERVKKKKGDGLDEKPITVEESLNAKVPEVQKIDVTRAISSVENTLQSLKGNLPQIHVLKASLYEHANQVNHSISENSTYKKIVSFLVSQKLLSKGYSKTQVGQMIDQAKSKQGRVNR